MLVRWPGGIKRTAKSNVVQTLVGLCSGASPRLPTSAHVGIVGKGAAFIHRSDVSARLPAGQMVPWSKDKDLGAGGPFRGVANHVVQAKRPRTESRDGRELFVPIPIPPKVGERLAICIHRQSRSVSAMMVVQVGRRSEFPLGLGG